MLPSSVAGPDFICTGMPKAGTGWLFDQLRLHPDFWLPPVKEFAYLLRSIPQLKDAEKRFQKLKRNPRKSRTANWSNRRQDDERDYKFLEEATSAIGRPMSIERYVALFRYKEGFLSGDPSSGYCALNNQTIEQIVKHLPNTKLILLARDPVDRAWSHISMWHRAGKFDSNILEDPPAFRSLLENTASFMRTSFPSAVVRAWRDTAPQLPFRTILFDDIRERPEEVRREILLYLAADPEKPSGDLVAGHNKKSSSQKLELMPAIREQLIDMFAEEIRACASLFGGQATMWTSRYGL